MNWPDKPLCHKVNPVFLISDEIVWRPQLIEVAHAGDGYPRNYPFRSCSYCGSIHPEDLLRALTELGAALTGSDWKYGWPHKFYVEQLPTGIPEGTEIKAGSNYANGVDKPIMGKQSKYAHAKWYNEHLFDLDAECFAAMAKVLFEHAHIEFFKDGEAVKYRAPSHGYQKWR